MSRGDQYEEREERPLKWFELLRLVRECPPRVNKCDIIENTRLLLNILAQHADGNTCETFVRRDTIAREMGVAIRTLDRAIAVLKKSELVSVMRRYNPVTKKGQSNIWTINRKLLEDSVAWYEDELTVRQILDFLTKRIKSGDEVGKQNGEMGVAHSPQPRAYWERIVTHLREKSDRPLDIHLIPDKDPGEEDMVTMHAWFFSGEGDC